MGTEIKLKAGAITLDYAKNHMGNDYGFLYQKGDEARRVSDQHDYEYCEENPEDLSIADFEESFVRPLGRVLPRLDILGFTLESARAEYEELLMETDDDAEAPGYLTFGEFCALVCRHPLSGLNDEYIDHDTPERSTIAQGRFAAETKEFERVPWTENGDWYWSEASYFAAKLCILSAPSMLRLFALNSANADMEIVWQFGPLVHAGWANRESFLAGATRQQAVLVVTEGASDVRIVKRAFEVFRPEVADFFRFIDVNERHHFWGTGKLVNFAEGLLRIDVQNKILFLLDNDAEGLGAQAKLQKLPFPPNMVSMVLPDLEDFGDFPARGPEGIRRCNINGRAAAIECYLDLRLAGQPPAQVIWSNYKNDTDSWQGALLNKGMYAEHFLAQSEESLRDGSFDGSKLLKLLDALIETASRMSPS